MAIKGPQDAPFVVSSCRNPVDGKHRYVDAGKWDFVVGRKSRRVTPDEDTMIRCRAFVTDESFCCTLIPFVFAISLGL